MVDGQRGGALPGPPGVGVPARRPRRGRGVRQLGGEPVVGLAGHGRAVPEPPGALPFPDERGGEQRVGALPLLARRVRPQRGPDEPVPHRDPLALEPQQPGLAGRVQVGGADAVRPRGPRHGRRAEPFLRRRHQHEPPRPGRKPQVAAAVQGAQGAGGRERPRRRRGAGQLPGGQRGGEVADRGGPPAGQVDDLLGEVAARRAVEGPVEGVAERVP
ncbi:hypothetical protein LUX57_37950 [Actinomadura madurae]|uniref:hypothetical protein n=1 Tax=Actinomadura madurae TaxID=1993 RepID=UPI0020D23088|nr:hypothetical protein [Actinomadura madurae]MCP9970258.1 hypothetical protein [Actinomadura madurae]